ncbi:hypothetical protein [Pseudonocardia nigra]|uniref:hypothetical protein n=1 Tax=Pseudonocardia nigra TaxID=1921578 RepID=UPI001C5D8E90|nr:hypothetical protein [Pseudonocardia nigra]
MRVEGGGDPGLGCCRGRFQFLQRPDPGNPLRVGNIRVEPGQPGHPAGDGARIQRRRRRSVDAAAPHLTGLLEHAYERIDAD